MKKIIVLIIALIITFIVVFTAMKITNGKNYEYEIEDVVNFSYFKLYENEKYGVIDKNGQVLVPAKYDLLEIPNPSKAIFIGYIEQKEEQYETEVVNDKNEKILENYSRG